jgi:hypothetical protein
MDLELVAWHGEMPVLLLAARVGDERGEQRPVAHVHPAQPRPAAGQPVAAGHGARGAEAGDQDAADHRVRAWPPDRALRRVWPLRQHEVVGDVLRHHPGGRAAALADRGQHVDDGAKMRFGAAEARRLQHAMNAAAQDVGAGGIRQPAQSLGFGGALAQQRRERAGALHHLLRGTDRRVDRHAGDGIVVH